MSQADVSMVGSGSAADGPPPGAGHSLAAGLWRRIARSSNLYILLVELLLIGFFSLISNNHVFFTSGNLVNVAWDTAETLLLAIGETFVIITAGIDLSVGTVLMLSGVV